MSKPSSITYLGYRITERCNEHCPFCFSREACIASDQSLTDIESSLQNIQRAGITTIGVMGGEPTLRTDLPHILKLMKKYGFEVVLSTNAVLLTPKLLAQISPFIDYLSISLDSHDQLMNDKWRGQGQYAAATKIISLYNPQIHPFKLKINTVVHQQNIDSEIDKIPLLFVGKPVVWKLLQYTPRLDGKKVKQQFAITKKAFLEKGKLLKRLYPKTIIALRTYTINEKYDLLLLRPNGDLEINYKEEYQIAGNVYKDEIKDIINKVWDQQTSYFNENWDEFEKSYRRL